MTNAGSSDSKLGVNGFGRIGKLTVWHHVARKYFGEIVVNIGRQAGGSLEDIAHYVERDSTYGWLHSYIYGHLGQPVISELDEDSGSMMIDGIKVSFLRNHRDPAGIGWEEYDVRLVSIRPASILIRPRDWTFPKEPSEAIWNPERKK